MADKTKDWKLYEAGKEYNNKLKPNLYDTVNANHAFYTGDQWRNLETEDMPKPVFNVIARKINFDVASLTTSKTKVHFEPLLYTGTEEQNQISLIANSVVENVFEQIKLDYRIKEGLTDGAISGDACMHFIFDMEQKPFGLASNIEGEITAELVDGTNVMFGNANSSKVDKQPYIIISGRSTAKELQAEAQRYKQTDQNAINEIQADQNFNEMSGDSSKIEVQSDEFGKALYIIVYRKKTIQREKKDDLGNVILDENKNPVMEEVTTIVASKSVENAYIYQDVDTGLSFYPVAWFNWQRQKNSYHAHANAPATQILPNQIFINRGFAMIWYHLMMTSFPKAVYNSAYISEWDNEIGSAIGVEGVGLEANIKNIAGYLEPGNMSPQIVQAIQLSMDYTKETLGISDVALGNTTNTQNTSAIIAIQKAAAIPLENPRKNLYEWIEDIGRIVLDMVGTYYGERPIVLEEEGQKYEVTYDFSQFKNMWLKIKTDVGEASYWSEIASIQTLDNLLMKNQITLADYLERIPDQYIPKKQELIDTLNMAQTQMPPMMPQMPGQGLGM